MKEDKDIFESLIAGGVIGAALGALLAKKPKDGTIVGALAGAVILATFKANEQAQKTNIPMYVEENGNLYELQPGNTKRFVKTIEKTKTKLPEHFKLK
jgi:hypothetical protein